MPRKSTAAQTVVAIDTGHARLTPRDNAPAEVRQIFREIVASVKPEHFRPADGALVEQYAQAIALARKAYGELESTGPVIDGKASPWVVVLEKAHRSSVALSARLRLCPQARTDPKTAGKPGKPASAYDMEQ